MTWAPDYRAVYLKRSKLCVMLDGDIDAINKARAYYKYNPIDFIETWCDTYNPRNVGTDKMARMPFVLFPKQKELVRFIQALLENKQDGLVEKSRDMGATWLFCALSAWLFLFHSGSCVGWGSRKAASVDRKGDTGCIFEKIRMILAGLPPFFLPHDFESKIMLISSNYLDTSIVGEGGENIGRGGRTTIYFKDESAHYTKTDAIEAALSENTDIQIDFSSVNGIGNAFYRKRFSGVEWDGENVHKRKTNVFILDWRDNPLKSQEWYDNKKAKMLAEGAAHLFAQEVDRDYASSVEGTIIKAEWIEAAVDAHIKLGWDNIGDAWGAALDVAGDGRDKNAFTARQGNIIRQVESWSEGDTAEAARKAISFCADKGDKIELQYDCIGIGDGVKSESNRLVQDGIMPHNIRFVAWHAAASPLGKDERLIKGDKDTPLKGDFYKNLKAQAWWELRIRFEKTFKAINEGICYDMDELISIDSTVKHLHTLKKELCQPVAKKSTSLKLMVDKKPEGTNSPDIADSVAMMFLPVGEKIFNYDNL